MRRRGFTLVEMLTVVAISGILITLIVVPLIQGFNLTRQAQALSEAQARARSLSERIAREIGNAVAVRDNTATKGSVTIVVPGKVGAVDPEVPITLPFAKLDIVRPAQGDPGRGPSGAFKDPDTGKEDPTATAPKGQIVLPLAPGATVVRYFIGLREPLTATDEPARYMNPYEGLLMPRSGQRDNLFSLYRSEFQPYVYTPAGPRVNTALFQDADADNQPDDIDDPAFFALLPGTDYNPATRVLTPAGVNKARRIRNWLGQGQDAAGNPLGRATRVTELQRFDMIQPVFDRRTRLVVYDVIDDPIEPGVARERPRIIPLAQFRPTRISSDPAEGQNTVRLGEESDNASLIAPDVFRTRFGGWSSTVIRTWTAFPVAWDRLDPGRDEYLVGRTDPRNGMPGFPKGFAIYGFDPVPAAEETLDGDVLFDVSVYESGVGGAGAYPFTEAVNAADALSGWLSDARMRELFTPYFPDPATGKLVASFGIHEMGDGSVPNPSDNLPLAPTGLAVSPLQAPVDDIGYDTSPYSPLGGAGYGVNRSFNRVWNEYDGNTLGLPNLRPDIHRFIDLRVTPQGDTTAGPLHPDPAVGFVRARVVPGSEEVFGPDQTPGAHYGRTVRYTRSTRAPGPNQYRINYVDQLEPDYALLGLPVPPPTYDATNFMSAVYQPRFKAGYLELNSDPNAPIPAGVFQVFYRFQFAHPGDSFAVDYDSRQVMSINLTMRTYPQSTLPNAQSITLKTSATVRNYIR